MGSGRGRCTWGGGTIFHKEGGYKKSEWPEEKKDWGISFRLVSNRSLPDRRDGIMLRFPETPGREGSVIINKKKKQAALQVLRAYA